MWQARGQLCLKQGQLDETIYKNYRPIVILNKTFIVISSILSCRQFSFYHYQIFFGYCLCE